LMLDASRTTYGGKRCINRSKYRNNTTQHKHKKATGIAVDLEKSRVRTRALRGADGISTQ